MTIGVDAGMLGENDKRLQVGVWRVAFHLLTELSKIDSKNTYRLYSFSPIPYTFGPQMKNVILRFRKGWFTFRLPLELKLHPVDIFLGLAQALPWGPGKKIGFVYDLGFLKISNNRLEKQTENLLDRADRIVTISQAVEKEITKVYGNKNITTVYPGVSEVFRPNGPVYKNRNPYFLFVGALKKSKNIPTLLRAFDEFLKISKKNIDLLIVGGDYWRDPQIQKGKNVKFLGHVDDKTLASLYRGARAFVSPSLYEGFCLPAAEAIATGIPVIGSTVGSFPEVVGKNGILVDPLDEKALVQALTNVVTIKRAASRRFLWPTFARTVYKLL